MTSLAAPHLNRRRFLGAVGAVGTTVHLSADATAQPAPRADALAAWQAATPIALWTGKLPSGGFRPQNIPTDENPTLIRNVARPELRIFYPARANGRSLLVIPGGAYTFLSIANEGVDVAAAMTALGYTVFVLIHRLPDEGWSNRADVALQDAQRAMRVIRAFAIGHGLDPEKVDLIGFSAGGHLAATLVTGFEERLHTPVDPIDALDARPGTAALIYPVIGHEPGIGHAESSRRLLGPDPGADLLARRSPAKHVTASTPPVFLVHALDDRAVPAENSFIFMRALQAADRPFELHLFERGGHAFGAGRPGSPAASWPSLYDNWLTARPVQAGS